MSSYTRIMARVTDQTIQLANVPLIASGGLNEVRVDFTFCTKWADKAKTAVFYRNPEQAYHVLMIDDSAVVPAEVLEQDGLLYFGVFGTSEEQVRTTEVVSLTVVKGAITFQHIDPAEPTPDIYQQLLVAYGVTERALAVERARVDELVAMRSSESVTQIELSAQNVTGYIKTNGVHAYAYFVFTGLSIPSFEWYETENFIPLELAPFEGWVETVNDVRIYLSSSNQQNGQMHFKLWNYSANAFNGDLTLKYEYALKDPVCTELADLRVGYDGTTYPTAGDAVREQVAALDSRLDAFTDYGIVIKGKDSAQVEVEAQNEETETGHKNSSLRFLGYSDGLVKLTGIADGSEDFDAATVGQVKEMVKHSGGGSVNKYYYTSFVSAVADLNASTTENADATAETAGCAVHTDDGNTHLTLLADIALAENVTISAPLVFNLNGHTISIPGDYKISFTANSVVDGTTEGSRIIKETTTNTQQYVLSFEGEKAEVIGGRYSLTGLTTEKSLSCIKVSANCFATIKQADIYAAATDGAKNAISVNSAGELKISGSKISAYSLKSTAQGIACNNEFEVSDCEIYINSIHGGGIGVYVAKSTALIENSTIFADGTTGSVSSGNENYAGTQGIYNAGNATIKNCNVYGTHTGIQCYSDSNIASITIIDGGLYEGVGHGGLYVGCGSQGKFFAENATFKNAAYRGKNKDKYFYNNGNYMAAAVYVGGGSGIKAYFDNCVLDGGGPEAMPDGDSFTGAEPIRLRTSDSEQNNAVYMSNCTLMGDGKIRFAHITHKLHYGLFNRFLCEPNIESCMVDEGRVIYTGYEQFRTI